MSIPAEIPAAATNLDSSGSGTGDNANGGRDNGNYVPSIDASCIHSFLGPKMYNWFAFRNDCGRPVHLEFIANSPDDHFGMSATDLAAGQSGDTGWSKSEVDKKGGLEIFVCPEGCVAVDATAGQVVSRPNQKFLCQKQ